MSSSSDSDTSAGSSPYVSDNEVKYCKSRCNSIDSDTYTDDIPGFVAEALDESERTEIATISEQGMKTSGDRFYPKRLKTYMQENEWNIYQQIINEVTEQKGWVFAAPSILQMISQCGHQKPRGVRYDVCHCSPGKPLKVLTFTSEDDSENRYVRYNARLTSMIINHIEQDIGQPLSAVYGVIDRTKHASDEEFGKRIRVLEIAAQKTSLPQTLHVDGHIYRKMTKSLLDLFSTTYSSRMTSSQETDNIPSLNFKQSKMADSMTDDDKDHGTDTGDKRALPNKEESLVAMPVAPIQHKVTESITDDEKRHGTDTDDKRDLQNKETSYVGMLVAAVRNMFQKKGFQEEVIDHQKKFEWNTKANYIWTTEEETRLRKDILDGKTDSNGEKIKMNLLVFGQSEHGKSTLCNGFRSALKGEGRVSHFFQTGHAEVDSTFTRGVQSSWHEENLRIMDMSGLYETDKFTDYNISNLLSGKVDFDEEMSEHLEVCNKAAKEPDAGTNNISCLVIVVRPDKEFGPHVKRLLAIADNFVKSGVISRHAVIPFLDKIDPIFKEPEKIEDFQESIKVKTAVKNVSDETGIPPSAISVVSNYWNQSETDLHTNILLLHVLDDILYDAKEHHEKCIARRGKTTMNRQKRPCFIIAN